MSDPGTGCLTSVGAVAAAHGAAFQLNFGHFLCPLWAMSAETPYCEVVTAQLFHDLLLLVMLQTQTDLSARVSNVVQVYHIKH